MREAYRIKGWAFDNAEGIVQCTREGWKDSLKEQAGTYAVCVALWRYCSFIAVMQLLTNLSILRCLGLIVLLSVSLHLACYLCCYCFEIRLDFACQSTVTSSAVLIGEL